MKYPEIFGGFIFCCQSHIFLFKELYLFKIREQELFFEQKVWLVFMKKDIQNAGQR